MIICYSLTLISTLRYLHLHRYLYLYPILLCLALVGVEERTVVRVNSTASTLYKKLDSKQSGVACGYTRLDDLVGWNGILDCTIRVEDRSV